MDGRLIQRQSAYSGSAPGLGEYWLVVQPDTAVRNKLLSERQFLLTDHGLKAPARSPGYITVARFAAQEALEATLSRWIQKICSHQRSFAVTLNNYSGLPPDTIYVRVQDPGPFRHFVEQLRPVDEYLRSSACPPALLNHKPYLSIAGKLPPDVYERAMPVFSRRTFHESFLVQELLLLKKDAVSRAFKTINVFGLLPGTHRLYTEMA